MKLLLEVRDEKAPELMQILKDLHFVKTTAISPAKALLVKQVKEAVDEINLIKSGKKKARDAQAFLHEL